MPETGLFIKGQTHNLLSNVAVQKAVVQVFCLIDVEARVDLDLQVFPVCVVEGTFGLVQLKSLTFLAIQQSVEPFLITNWRLKCKKY